MAHSSRILFVEPNIVFLVANCGVFCLNVMLHTCSTFHFIQFRTVTHTEIYMAHDLTQRVVESILKFNVVCPPHNFTTSRRLSRKVKVPEFTLLLSVVSVMKLHVFCLCGLTSHLFTYLHHFIIIV
jgi:hypothetical protein